MLHPLGREQILFVETETLDLHHRSPKIGDLQYESTGVEHVELLPLRAGGLGRSFRQGRLRRAYRSTSPKRTPPPPRTAIGA